MKHRATLALGLTVSFAVPVHAGDWDDVRYAPVPLGVHSQIGRGMSIDAAGTVTTLYTEYAAAGTYDIYARRISPAGVLDPVPTKVNQGPGYARPALAAAADGSFVVAWGVRSLDAQGFGHYTVMARLFDAAGQPRGDEFTVTAPGSFANYFVRVATNGAGDFAVVWPQEAGDHTSVRARLFDAGGAPLGAEIAIDDRPLGDSAAYTGVALTADRTLVVSAVPREDESGSGNAVVRCIAGGVVSPAVFLDPGAPGTGGFYSSQLAVAPDGTTLAAWIRGSGTLVLGGVGPGCGTVQPAVALPAQPTAAGYVGLYGLLPAADGSAVTLAWSDYDPGTAGPDDQRQRVFMARFALDGTQLAGRYDGRPHTLVDFPGMVADPAGRITLAVEQTDFSPQDGVYVTGLGTDRVSTAIAANPYFVSLVPGVGYRLKASATLTSQGAPVANGQLLFASGNFRCLTLTDAQGYAECGGPTYKTLSQLGIVLNHGYEASFPGDTQYRPSSARAAALGVP